MSLTLDPIRAAADYADRLGARADRHAAARAELHDEFFDALLGGDPTTPVQVPAWGRQTGDASVADVVGDSFAGDAVGASLATLLRIVAGVAAGKDQRAEALAWIDAQAREHADTHCGDLADQRAGEWDDSDSDAARDQARDDAMEGV